jgi:hypothetical protein
MKAAMAAFFGEQALVISLRQKNSRAIGEWQCRSLVSKA